jgi:hypothetical protein
MKVQIPKPHSGGLILSYKCNAQCKHCMYACTPEWSADWISEKELNLVLAKLSKTIEPSLYGPDMTSLNHGLHFTGGEPFLNYTLLCRAVEIATEYGIPSTFVETNCFWCRSDKVTAEKLQHLKSKGMKGIMISVNPFYLEYVPFERTQRCIEISREIFGQNAMIYQWEYYRRFKQLGIKGRLSLEQFIEMEGGTGFLQYAEFFMMGRAPYKLLDAFAEMFPRSPAEYFLDQPCWPPIMRDWHNHFDNYGNYMPGFCGGITLGDCRKIDGLLKEGIDLQKFPVLGFLIQEDMNGLLKLAEKHGYESDERGYLSKCHLCLDIRKHLASENDFQELQPREFYHHLQS